SGCGEPMTASSTLSRTSASCGRSAAWKNGPREVPPRMNTHGIRMRSLPMIGVPRGVPDAKERPKSVWRVTRVATECRSCPYICSPRDADELRKSEISAGYAFEAHPHFDLGLDPEHGGPRKLALHAELSAT